ncbi:ATP-binding protein [Candidatus Palauibacter sp.]|uniref:ATP-binding protein n=1 Tax=Candidatus Palauibacter sp. TaxID=3101350 RepID=UPI003AF2ADCD
MRPAPYLPRILEATLRARLEAFPVVVVTGARQTGKSTLARELEGHRRAYLTLDDYGVLDQAEREPDALLARGPHVTLDEIQRAPELLLAIKRAVDTDRAPGRFLLTGSANLDLMKGVSETLAGRAVYVTLWPMTRGEAAGGGSAGRWDVFLDEPPRHWIDALAGGDAPTPDGPPAGDSTTRNPERWKDLVRRGGYPFPALNLASEADRAAWFEAYLRTYLERDLRQLAAIENLLGFQRLARAAALRLGGLSNQASLARDAGIPPTTAQRYLDLLEVSYQLLRVESYAVNRNKRLVKQPRLYWSDPGLALHLAGGIEPTGAHLENLVACDLFAWRETRLYRPNILFWRTSKGAEVDFVIETPRTLIPVEVKSRRALRVSDARHLVSFMRDYGEAVPAGVIIHGGRDTYWLTERALALPWHQAI